MTQSRSRLVGHRCRSQVWSRWLALGRLPLDIALSRSPKRQREEPTVRVKAERSPETYSSDTSRHGAYVTLNPWMLTMMRASRKCQS